MVTGFQVYKAGGRWGKLFSVLTVITGMLSAVYLQGKTTSFSKSCTSKGGKKDTRKASAKVEYKLAGSNLENT